MIVGWHYARTAGLWGTFNNEPFDDLNTPNHSRPNINDLGYFGDSWAVNEQCKTKIYVDSFPADKLPSKDIATLCHEFFQSKVSDLSTCFSRVPKHNFLNMCMNSTTTQEACASAVGYIEMCHRENTPLNIPDSCIK